MFMEQENEGETHKAKLSYSIMIGQPNFVTTDLFDKALEEVKIKKPNQPMMLFVFKN